MAISAALASLIEQLRKVVFLTGLDDSVLAALARDALWRDYAAGEVVFLEGETSPGLYVLQRGWLKVLKTLVAYRLIDPGSEWQLHRQWFDTSAQVTQWPLQGHG